MSDVLTEIAMLRDEGATDDEIMEELGISFIPELARVNGNGNGHADLHVVAAAEPVVEPDADADLHQSASRPARKPLAKGQALRESGTAPSWPAAPEPIFEPDHMMIRGPLLEYEERMARELEQEFKGPFWSKGMIVSQPEMVLRVARAVLSIRGIDWWTCQQPQREAAVTWAKQVVKAVEVAEGSVGRILEIERIERNL